MFEVSRLSANYKSDNFAFKNAADSTFLPKPDLARFALKASNIYIYIYISDMYGFSLFQILFLILDSTL